MKKYYQVHIAMMPEILERYNGYISRYAKEIVYQIVEMAPKELKDEVSKYNKEEVEKFYKGTIRHSIYVDKETNNKWTEIPWLMKKPVHYLINLKLLEKAKEVGL